VRIRWKLFWLLAAISLAPLLLLRVNSQFTLARLSERLSARVAAHLVEEAQKRLPCLVENHARLLNAKRQALSLAAALQARDVAREDPRIAALDAFRGDKPLEDDVTLVVLKLAA
jgi:sigma-B regulation protein RsbU (phosphoserine phosphatase)